MKMTRKDFLAASAAFVSAGLVCMSAACVAKPDSSVGSFAEAKPVWIAGEERATNSFCAIRSRFNGDSGAAVLRVTAAYDYRVRLNGRFVGFGPVRGPAGVFRIDEWKLDAKAGDNVLEVEAAGYCCNCYYYSCY